MRIALAQINPTVGDLDGNARAMVARVEEADRAGAELVAFPELVVCGYPPEDLLLKEHFLLACRKKLVEVAAACPHIAVLAGIPWWEEGRIYNCAAVLNDGGIVGLYRKVCLPNYAVFDEKRYFTPGCGTLLVDVHGMVLGLNICEDIWDEQAEAVRGAVSGGAQAVVNLSMSPYHVSKGRQREQMLSRRARQGNVFVCYINGVGGQDELVFDGQSLVLDPEGRLLARACQFREELLVVDLDARPAQSRPAGQPADIPAGVEIVRIERQGAAHGGGQAPLHGEREGPLAGGRQPTGPLAGGTSADTSPATDALPASGADQACPCRTGIADCLSLEAEVYEALCLGVRDYVRKNRFCHVVLGLSGGIDSALTVCVAADALGSANVTAVSMPSRFSSAATKSDARETGERLGIDFREMPIESIFSSYLESLRSWFPTGTQDIAEQNVQARIRGNLLMALSNKFGWLVLTTGNKSEMAVGYATLYGDMAGGFAVLKDVPKTLVYRLSAYRNSLGPGSGPIPVSTIERVPSAELAEDQTDQDVLPPYDILDRIVEAYVERDQSVEEIAGRGIDRAEVERVVAMIDGNEYKRRQAAPGVRITPKAFGKDRRLPITNRYRG